MRYSEAAAVGGLVFLLSCFDGSVANDYLQRWPVSKRVNSSRASDDDSTLIEKAA